MIVTLCGSLRLYEEIKEIAAQETAKGNIVLMPIRVPHPDREALARLHRQKINLAEEVICVTNHYGYIGDATRAEMDYAEAIGKPTRTRTAWLTYCTHGHGASICPRCPGAPRA